MPTDREGVFGKKAGLAPRKEGGGEGREALGEHFISKLVEQMPQLFS
jgi:hypothetical protein